MTPPKILDTYILYVHENKINGKRYFGITKQRPVDRWGRKGQKYTDNKHFSNAIKKYGWDNFSHTVILQGLSLSLAVYLERRFISHYKTYKGTVGYNISLGGEGAPMAECIKEKLSQTSKLKRPVICLEDNKIFSSMSAVAKFLGKNKSDISLGSVCNLNNKKAHTLYGKHYMFLSDYKSCTREQIDEIKSRKKKQFMKQVICLETKVIYKSIAEAQEVYGDGATLSECCNGYHQTAAGLHWMFYEEYKTKTEEEIQDIINEPNKFDLYKKPVVCLETQEIFESLSDVDDKLHVGRGSIHKVCVNKKNRKTAGGLHFMFLEDYKKATPEEIVERLNAKAGIDRLQVVCLDNLTIYRSANHAATVLGLGQGHVRDCCKGLMKGTKGFHFCYLQDYEGNKEDLNVQTFIHPKRTPARKVVCLNTKQVYNSIREASKQTSCNQMSIRHCCQHILKQTKGYYWVFYDEYVTMKETQILEILQNGSKNNG